MTTALDHPHDLQRDVPDRLPATVLRDLSVLQGGRAARAIAEEWLGIGVALVLAYLAWGTPLVWAYPLYVLWVGARQHALAILLHDAVHYRLFTDHRVNDAVGNVLLGWPVFITVEGFRSFHGDHHRFTNAASDGNRRLWSTHDAAGAQTPEWRFPKRRAELALRLLWRGVGVTGLWWMVRGILGTFRIPASAASRVGKLAVYAVAATLLTHFHGWWAFCWLWAVPFCTWHVIAQYVRLMCEHSAIPAGPGEYAVTRTTIPGLWGRLFVIPRHIGYHAEHHWYPSVPFYRLPELHQALMGQAGFRAHAVVRTSIATSLRELCVAAPPPPS